MGQALREVMSTNPVALPGDTPVRNAAEKMAERDIGNVLVVDDGKVAGIDNGEPVGVFSLGDFSLGDISSATANT